MTMFWQELHGFGLLKGKRLEMPLPTRRREVPPKQVAVINPVVVAQQVMVPPATRVLELGTKQYESATQKGARLYKRFMVEQPTRSERAPTFEGQVIENRGVITLNKVNPVVHTKPTS